MQTAGEPLEPAKRALGEEDAAAADARKRTRYDSPAKFSEGKKEIMTMPLAESEHTSRTATPSGRMSVNGAGDMSVSAPGPVDVAAQSEGEPRKPKEKKRKKRELVPPLEQWVYSPTDLLPELHNHIKQTLQVLIPAKFLTKNNERVHDRQLWGSDLYTDDSDIVAVLVHIDALHLTDVQPDHDLLVTLRILPIQEKYPAVNRNGVKSRRCTRESHDGCSIMVEKVDKMKPKAEETAQQGTRKEKTIKARVKSKNMRKRERNNQVGQLLPDVSVIFSLANDPCFRYTLNMVADRGTAPRAFTSYRLRQEVLYVETDRERFELSCQPITPGAPNWFKWARVHKPQLMSLEAMKALECPLPQDQVTVMEKDLPWSDFEWGFDSVSIRGTKYNLMRAFWRPRTNSL